MKLIIVGGTGLLGYHATYVALERGYEVASLAIDDASSNEWYPKEVRQIIGDVFKMSEEELINVFNGFDEMIYAVGPDDRYSPNEDAYNFFHLRLVEHCAKVYRAARKAGIKKSSLCSSYFLYFDRKFPEKKLSIIHPYIKVRKEQAERIIDVCHSKMGNLPSMEICIMELPYIFGTCPHRTPLWKETFLDRFANGWKTIYFPKGGSVMASTRNVGEALVGALQYGEDGKHYAIGVENHTFNWMLDRLLIGIQGKPRKIVNPPVWICALAAKIMMKKDLKKGIHHGLDFVRVIKDIQSDYFYYPEDEIEATCSILHISQGGVEEALIETGRACYKHDEFK